MDGWIIAWTAMSLFGLATAVIGFLNIDEDSEWRGAAVLIFIILPGLTIASIGLVGLVVKGIGML